MAVQVKLRAFRGPPVGSNLRKLPDDERFDVWPAGLLILKIRADIADVRIGEADNLPRIAGIGENFLVTGEAGIENDFAAPARDGASGAAVKDAPVFQREDCGSLRNFGQRVLLSFSCTFAIHFVLASAESSKPK